MPAALYACSLAAAPLYRAPACALRRISSDVAVDRVLVRRPNFANIGPVRRRATDRIANGRVDCQVEIRAVRMERIGIGNSQLVATLPPAMLTDDNAWIELFAEPRPGSHAAGRRAHVNPIAILDAACRGRRRIEFDLRMQRALAQACEGAVHPEIELNPATAAARGIKDGDWVDVRT